MLLIVSAVTVSCTKKEIKEVYEPYYIENNDPPEYSGVTTLQVQNYVSRLYIDILGEQPQLDVLEEKVGYLQENDLSPEARETLIFELMEDDEYYVNLYNYTSIQMINGVPREEIAGQIALFELLIQQYYDAGEVQLAQFYEYELEKLEDLYTADAALQAGDISVNGFYRRFCFNSIYDEINMGSENMVISCFENLFSRYPTQEELLSGVSMVDGVSAVLLQQSGNSKGDFVNIVTTTPEFYLGRVFEQYQRLMLREPTPIEEDEGSTLLQQTGSLQQLQASLLKTDEYAGF